MKSPFFTPGYVSRSTNVADARRINLYPEIVETKNGKAVGAYYMAPGLDLLTTCGIGPIYGLHVMNDTLYVVSGIEVYSVDSALNVTKLGTMPSEGPVSMVDNGSQLGIFYETAAFYVGNSYAASSVGVAATPAGQPAPANFAPGEHVTLAGGTYATPAVVTVLTTQVSAASLVYAGSGGNNLCGVLTASVVSGGSGGTNGTVTITGTTGTGTKFQATGTIVGGALAGPLAVTNTGSYTVNPTVLTAEPVTGGSLVGATVSLTLQPLPQTVTGTTGTGTKFTASVLVAIGGGAIIQVNGVTSPGSYTANPTTVAAEPVSGAGLTGAVLALTMAPATASIATAGTYTSQPSNPVSQLESSGSGSNSYWNVNWTASANALTQITLPFSSGVTGASYQDGFALVTQAESNTWWQSNLFDMATWNVLNFASAEGNSGDLVTLAAIHREQWLFKDNCVEVWVNAGNAGFAFQRLEGVFIETGCAAAFSVAKVGEALMWLTENDEGQGQIVMARGYQPVVVSNHWIEREIASYATIADAVAYSYQQEGHLFYVITFPTGDATWVYDATTSAQAGVPMWHQRAAFSNGQFHRHRGSRHCLFRGQHVLGDYQTGKLYVMDLDTQTDNGAQRKWLMTWRALPQAINKPVRFTSLQIDMQTGIGVPAGTNPLLMLRWSDDGGHTWSSERLAAAGKTGETTRRVKFIGLGSTRRNSGLDRIFELSATDPFAVALIGADLT